MSSEVFISWSGELSHRVAQDLRAWIQHVLPEVEAWLSEDIAKGTRWLNSLSNELAKAKFGVLVLTRKNIKAPWIIFEAGALFKGLSYSSVCPLLVDIKPKELHDLAHPLAHFQCAELQSKQDMLNLIKSIFYSRNDSNEESLRQ
jgi:hypothetical protein